MKRWMLLLTMVCALSVGCMAAEPETLAAGALQVTASFDGGDAKIGQNILHITVSDRDGAKLPGAVVTVDPQMPTHGHGSSETPVVKDGGQGAYTASPVTLQMQGHWKITVTATHDTETGATVLDVTL
ncbi:MAG: FixH family protein [Myxococcales bacterium]|nr:FixH family protein [Myxococcales bacterium]